MGVGVIILWFQGATGTPSPAPGEANDGIQLRILWLPATAPEAQPPEGVRCSATSSATCGTCDDTGFGGGNDERTNKHVN